MLDKKNNIKIGTNSNGNSVIQDSVVNNHYTIMPPSEADVMNLLAGSGQYEIIQQLAKSSFAKFKSTHPLYPDFEARYDEQLDSLVSRAASREAYEKYPLTIKSKITIDRTMYPDMDPKEYPWDYAYRTQKTVECKADDVKEFLGGIEDPYPTIGNAKVEKMFIQPPPFPEEKDAIITSGDVSLHFKFRQKPSDEYGVIVHGNESKNLGFDFLIRFNTKSLKFHFTINTDFSAPLDIQNQREAFYVQVKRTKKIEIFVNEHQDPISIAVDEEAFLSVFSNAEILHRYSKNLLFIEACLGCKFKVDLSNVEYDDYVCSCIVSSSIKHEYHLHYLSKETIEGFPMEAVTREQLEESKGKTDLHLAFDTNEYHFSLAGVNFVADTFKSAYQEFRIENIDALLDIELIGRQDLQLIPAEGKTRISLFMIYEGLKIEGK